PGALRRPEGPRPGTASLLRLPALFSRPRFLLPRFLPRPALGGVGRSPGGRLVVRLVVARFVLVTVLAVVALLAVARFRAVRGPAVRAGPSARRARESRRGLRAGRVAGTGEAPVAGVVFGGRA